MKPYKIEREWIHAGLSCAVVQGREGQFRCGYVRVPPSNSLHGRNYDELDVEVHGGLTFADLEHCAEHEDGQGWWFGFDCAHWGDLYWDPNLDPKLLSPDTRQAWEITERVKRQYPIKERGEVYRDQLYVERECEHLAEQLAVLTMTPATQVHQEAS